MLETPQLVQEITYFVAPSSARVRLRSVCAGTYFRFSLTRQLPFLILGDRRYPLRRRCSNWALSLISSAARCVRGAALSCSNTSCNSGESAEVLPWHTRCGFDLLIDEAFTP